MFYILFAIILLISDVSATTYEYNTDFIATTKFTTIAVLRPTDEHISADITCSGSMDLRMVDLTNYQRMINGQSYITALLITADNIVGFHLITAMKLDSTYLIVTIDKNTIFSNHIVSKIIAEDEQSSNYLMTIIVITISVIGNIINAVGTFIMIIMIIIIICLVIGICVSVIYKRKSKIKSSLKYDKKLANETEMTAKQQV